MLEVRRENYDDLGKEEQESASNNGSGKEYASYLRVLHNGETILLESDTMEIEDVRFFRDLSWVQKIILRSYELGRMDGVIDFKKYLWR